MNQHVKLQFDAVAQQYDQQRRALIPCFDDFYGMAVLHAQVADSVATPRILDLGAGTGLLSAFLLQKYPQAHMALIDLSAGMLEQARARFEGTAAAPRITYILGDYIEHPFPEPFDLIVSSLSIHHLEDADKARLFYRVFGLLKPGGRFINADQASGSTPYFEAMHKRQWEAAIRRTDLPEAAIASAIERRRLDRNASVPDQLRWLREAGFAEADCVYKYHEFAVFYAEKG